MAFTYDEKPNKTGKLSNPSPTFQQIQYSIEAIVNAYGFMAIIFSLNENLKYKTQAYMTQTIFTGLTLVTLMYVLISLSGILMYGDALEEANANLMQNINTMYANDQRWIIFVVSSIVRLIISTILLCHIPFNFFMAKDSLLICVDEINRQTTSRQLGLVISNPNPNEQLISSDQEDQDKSK